MSSHCWLLKELLHSPVSTSKLTLGHVNYRLWDQTRNLPIAVQPLYYLSHSWPDIVAGQLSKKTKQNTWIMHNSWNYRVMFNLQWLFPSPLCWPFLWMTKSETTLLLSLAVFLFLASLCCSSQHSGHRSLKKFKISGMVVWITPVTCHHRASRWMIQLDILVDWLEGSNEGSNVRLIIR